MAGTQGTDTRTLADLNESERALVEFKTLLNEKLPQIFPHMQGWGKLLYDEPEYDASLDAMDPAFLDILNQTVFDNSKRVTNTEIRALHDAYEKLPTEVKAPITLTRQMFDAPSVDVTANAQSTAVVNLGQTYLGVDHSDSALINQDTGRALSVKISKLEVQNPDIQTDLIPQYYDQRMVDFLDDLVEKRMNAAGITPTTDVNRLMVDTWSQKQNGEYIPSRAMANLAEAVALRNMAELMVNRQLPNDLSGAPIKMDTPWNTGWNNDSAPDLFFSKITYDSLKSNYEVSRETLFGDYSSNPNSALLKEFADKIGLNMYQDTYSQTDVGKLAAEMLAYQAKELCIPEHEVNAAIHDGRLMPNESDLLLIERGYGFPPGELSDAALYKTGREQLEMEYYGPIRDAVIEYRNVEFVNRFGGFSDDEIFRLQKIRGGENAVLNREEGLRDFGSPSRYYTSYKHLVGIEGPTEYNYKREHEYLPYLSERHAAGTIGGMCRVAPVASQDGDFTPDTSDEACTVEKVLEDKGTPCEGDECTVEAEVERRIKAGTIKPCDDFSGGAGADSSASDKIQTNMSDTTGQSADACTVEAEITRRLEGGELARPCDDNSVKLK